MARVPILQPGTGKMVAAILVTFPLATGLWFAVYRLFPAMPPPADTAGRLLLGVQWSAVAILLAFAVGFEAIAHERLFSPAIDPLAGKDSRRLIVNQRYVQNTLEQLWVFVPGLILLACYADGAGGIRVVPATAITWIVGRWAFWIGYHINPLLRGAGIFSMMLGLALLAYDVWRIGRDLFGPNGGWWLLAPFLVIEMLLVALALRPARDDDARHTPATNRD